MRTRKYKPYISNYVHNVPAGLSQPQCKSSAFPPTSEFLLQGNIHYLPPDREHGTGQLVIAPSMKFTCDGYISGWSTLTQFRSNDLAIDHLRHDIAFQVWRPKPGVANSYTFVGSKRLKNFIGRRLRDGLTVINDTQFFNFTSFQPSGARLHFQSGDVLGWYIHTSVQSVDIPLTVVYRQPAQGSDGQAIDLYRTVIDNGRSRLVAPEEISLESSQTTLIPSVIPYVNVDYGKCNK